MSEPDTVRAVVVCAAIAGCAPPSLALEVPPLTGANSAIFAVLHQNELRAAWAVDPAVPLVPTLDAPADQSRAWWLGLSATLGELGVEAGPLVAGAGGQPLPEPEAVFSRALGPEGAWEQTPELPSALAQARFVGLPPPGPACPRFAISAITLPSSGSVVAALELPAGEVLVGTSDEEMFHLRPDVAPSTVTLSQIELRFSTGALDAAGRVWLGNQHGCLLRGEYRDRRLDLESLGCEPSGAAIHSMVVTGAGDSAEIYLITRYGELMRWTLGGGFSRLHAFSFGELFNDGRVALDDRGRIFAAVYGSPRLIRIEDGVTVEESPPLVGAYLTALEFVPGFGLTVGDASGLVLRWEAGRWEVLGDPGFFYGVTTFAVITGRLWVVGGTGETSLFTAEGFCPVEQSGASAVLFVRRLGDGWVLLGPKHPLSMTLGATWVRLAE